jgi:hypothetical protein
MNTGTLHKSLDGLYDLEERACLLQPEEQRALNELRSWETTWQKYNLEKHQKAEQDRNTLSQEIELYNESYLNTSQYNLLKNINSKFLN